MRKLRLTKTDVPEEMLQGNARTGSHASKFQVYSRFHYSIPPLSPFYRSHPGLFLIWKEKGKINIWEMALTSQEEKIKAKASVDHYIMKCLAHRYLNYLMLRADWMEETWHRLLQLILQDTVCNLKECIFC